MWIREKKPLIWLQAFQWIDWFGGSAASKEQNKSFPFFIFEEVAQGYLQCTSSNIEQCQMSPLTFCMYYLA
jgi:hypothetical protein